MDRKIYFGLFTGYEDMIEQWGDIVSQPVPNENDVLFACYEYENYSGDALVIFKHGDKLYEVHGGHCSCYGLSEVGYSGGSESQWKPEETSWKALNMRSGTGFSTEANEAFETLVKENL